MPVLQTMLVWIAVSSFSELPEIPDATVSASSAGQNAPPAVDAAAAAAPAKEFPQTVVAGWLELHGAGKRDEAAALTTGNSQHQASHLPGTLVAGLRVAKSLGSSRAAAVVTSPFQDAPGNEQVLLFWLVRSRGHWRINKSESLQRQIVDERLRGFLEAGDVEWLVRQSELLGQWQSGPCRPPGFPGIACGSRLRLTKDNQFRLAIWGPAGPPEDAEGDEIKEGKWQLSGGTILLSHQQDNFECRVTWWEDNLLVLESPDGKSRVQYHRVVKAE